MPSEPTAAPLFTVVVPAYQAADTIGDTLTSLAVQTDKDFEVIVVDDGSSDTTFEVAQRCLAEHGIPGQIIRRAPDRPKGVSAARNTGIDAARGAWIVLLDADDRAHPDRLSAIRGAIRQWPDVRLIHHSVQQFGDVTSIAGEGDPSAPQNLFDRLLQTTIIKAPAVAMHRDTLRAEAGGFDERLSVAEDWLCFLLLSRRLPWIYIDRPLTYYCVRRGSMSQGRDFAWQARALSRFLTVAATYVPDRLSRADLATLRHNVGARIRWFSTVTPGVARGVVTLLRHGELGIAGQVVATHLRRYASRAKHILPGNPRA